MTIPQWTSEVPTQDGDYWLTYRCNPDQTMRTPSLARICTWAGGKPNVALSDGTCPKRATFVKQNPTALWCEVIPPPPIPATNGDTK